MPTIAFVSPKGGAGKTTSAFLLSQDRDLDRAPAQIARAVRNRLRTRSAAISAQLSDRTCSGAPCYSMHSPNLSITSWLFDLRATRMARHSRRSNSHDVIER